MMPIRRDLSFNLPADKMSSWHPWGKHISHFFNSLSIFFPVGERFFIDSIRHYRDQGIIEDEKLLEAIKGFIGQEAMHGREHEEYNKAYAEAGFEAEQMEALVARLLDTLQKVLPPEHQLSATCALEHFTAMLAHILLDTPSIMHGTEKHFRDVWYWHALEETEHKAVAYDVYKEVMKDKKLYGYSVRITGLIVATIIFWSLVYPFYLRNVQRDGGVLDFKGWRRALKFHFWNPGFALKIIPPYLDYFKPGFHPWDHDNREFVERVEELAKSYNAKWKKQEKAA